MANTSFQAIFDQFLLKITDDMYVEWTKEDTIRDLSSIFSDAIVGFEFPRFPLYDYTPTTIVENFIDQPDGSITVEFDIEYGEYNCGLTAEEINILALLMLNTWLQRQITSIENTRLKATGSDYKISSQANHLAKLMTLKQETERQTLHM